MVVAAGGGDGTGRVTPAMERNAGAMSKDVAKDEILG